MTRHSELSNGLYCSSFATSLCWVACSNQPEQKALGEMLAPCATGETGAMPTLLEGPSPASTGVS